MTVYASPTHLSFITIFIWHKLKLNQQTLSQLCFEMCAGICRQPSEEKIDETVVCTMYLRYQTNARFARFRNLKRSRLVCC